MRTSTRIPPQLEIRGKGLTFGLTGDRQQVTDDGQA